MKKVIVVLVSLILSVAIVEVLPTVLKKQSKIEANISNETSLVKQEILSYSSNEKTYNKLYANGELVGVISDLDYLNGLIKEKYKDYEQQFPNTELGLSNDVYIVSEKTFSEFENVDDNIMNYLVDNNLLGIKVTSIEFSTSDGVYETIYVKNVDDFNEAKNKFIMNFIDEDAYNKLINKATIEYPEDNGYVENSVSIKETITYKDSIASFDEIFESEDEIYDFLCYGRDTSREYYTVKEGDTLQSILYFFNQNMLDKHLVSLNRDILQSVNQIITPGMKLNVKYFTSPITVIINKYHSTISFDTPDTPTYIEDPELETGEVIVEKEEKIGKIRTIYNETYENGVLVQSGKGAPTQIGEAVVVEKKEQGVIRVGTKLTYLVGTGNYVWPVDYPYITVDFGGYYGHTGTDFVNLYEKYCAVYAVDSGVVDEVGYKYDMGYYCMINHGNGIRTFYMHLNVPSYVDVGENVVRGQIIGQEGNTGNSDGAHLHLTFEVDGNRVNACRYLPCNLIR